MQTTNPHNSPDNPRVAFFLPSLGGGGAEKMMVVLANELAMRGYKVDFVLVQAVGVNLKLLSESVDVIDLKAINTYFCLPSLVSYLRNKRPRVLLSSLELTNMFALMARAVSHVDAQVVLRLESMLSARRRAPWKKRLEKILLTLMYPYADGIIAVSGAVAEDAARFLSMSRTRIRTIYNPVITPGVIDQDDQGLWHPWFAQDAPPVVLGIGRLTAQKGFATLLEAFAVVRKSRPARLFILGEGEQREFLENRAHQLKISNYVEMPGFVENPQSYIRKAKVFVLSSTYEGLPTVLIEALAGGCPVISTDCPGGSREILADGEYGELVPIGDASAMAAAICRILDGNCRHVDRQWLNQFTLEHVVPQLLKVLSLPVDAPGDI